MYYGSLKTRMAVVFRQQRQRPHQMPEAVSLAQQPAQMRRHLLPQRVERSGRMAGGARQLGNVARFAVGQRGKQLGQRHRKPFRQPEKTADFTPSGRRRRNGGAIRGKKAA